LPEGILRISTKRTAYSQAKAISKSGVKVTFIAADTRSLRRWRKLGIERKEISEVKMIILNIPLGRIPKKVHDFIKTWAVKFLYKIVVKEYGVPDIVHAHFINNGYVTLCALENTSIPIILTEHYSAMSLETLETYYQRLEKFLITGLKG
jgi:L-malate glycosyltransferase